MNNSMSSLPHNVEAEQSVLGAILIEGGVLEKVSLTLTRDDFYRDSHKMIFDAMIQMSQEQIPIDVLMLYEYLKSKGSMLEDTGGSSYLTYLEEVVPTTANVEYYANLVKEKSIERQISVTCISNAQRLNSGNLTIQEATEKLQSLADSIHRQERSRKIISLGSQNEPQPREWLLESILPMNFPSLGYGLGGTGKSYFALFLAIQESQGNQRFLDYEFYEKPLNTLYVDYELDQEELTRRAYEVARGLGITRPPKNLFYHSPKNNFAAFSKELRSIARSEEIKFVIIDSLGASRLDSSDEIQVIERFDELRDSGVTSLLLDHHAKMQAQDNIELKTPYGSVFKFNMARSVFQLVLDKPLDNGLTLRFLHKKLNFGRLQPELLLDVIFDKDAVLICTSDSVSQETEQMLLIQDVMVKMLTQEGFGEINQNHLIERFKGIIGRDKLIALLRKGKDKYWFVGRGEMGNSLIYIPLLEEFRDLISKFGNSKYIYNQNIRISDDAGNDEGLEPPPNFL